MTDKLFRLLHSDNSYESHLLTEDVENVMAFVHALLRGHHTMFKTAHGILIEEQSISVEFGKDMMAIEKGWRTVIEIAIRDDGVIVEDR